MKLKKIFDKVILKNSVCVACHVIKNVCSDLLLFDYICLSLVPRVMFHMKLFTYHC